MIESAHLINFQKWKDKFINFHSKINVIVGESRQGKSSIFRALLFNLLNECKKTNFVNWDAKFAEVVTVINNSTVIRRKNMAGTKNEYEIDELPLKSFGTDVPEEVQKITRMEEINIERQHDPYFLISEKPGPLGSYLNQLVGLENIDEAFVKSSSMQNEVSAKLKAKKEQISEIEVQRDSLAYLSTCSDDFQRLCSLQKSAEVLDADQEEIASKIDAISKIDASLDFDIDKVLKSGKKLSDKREEILDIEEKADSIEKLIEDYPEEIKLGNMETLILQAKGAVWLKEQKTIIQELIYNFDSSNNSSIKKEMEDILKQLKEISPLCPTCGGKWNAVHSCR